jgi:DNA-binding MltR family transcriptional regulator
VAAVAHLPLDEAGPLTQLNVAVAGAWGLGVLKEVESPRLQAVFASAVGVALCGAALLSW